jgi:hypothetical protein
LILEDSPQTGFLFGSIFLVAGVLLLVFAPGVARAVDALDRLVYGERYASRLTKRNLSKVKTSGVLLIAASFFFAFGASVFWLITSGT